MKITVLAVGKLKEKYWREATEEYLRRLSAFAKPELIEIPDADREANTAECVQKREAGEILKRLPEAAYVVALDAGGRQRSSEKLAAHIEKLKVQGRSHFCFIIGGSHGLAPEILARADESLSFGAQTWPHNMVRVMLVEQLYRAGAISTNHPYHK